MNDSFESHDELTERLGALGRHPVAPSLQSQHLTAMSAVGTQASFRTMLASRVKLGAAVLGGFLIGATGLTTAGAMGPLQPIAKTTVEAVTPFELPETASDKAKAKAAKRATKDQDKADKSERPKQPKYWEGCVAAYGTVNRGQYLKNAKEDEANPGAFETARESDCGKSLSAVHEGDDGDDAADAGEAPKAPKAEKPDDDDAADKSNRGGSKPAGAGTPAERGGKSGITETPDDPPVTPTPAEGSSHGEANGGGARAGGAGESDEPESGS